MTITKLIVTRDELMLILCLENAFVTRWSGAGAERAFVSTHREGRPGIPPLPRLEGLGKGTRYHLATVEKWLLKYFQKGGDPVEKR